MNWRMRGFIPTKWLIMWSLVKAWFGRKVVEWGIVANDEDSKRYDAVDRELDYQEWFEREWKNTLDEYDHMTREKND